MGEVGKLSEEIESELPYWLLVLDHQWSPRILDECTMEEILVINSLLKMRKDYDEAMKGQELFKSEHKKKS